MAPSKRLKKAPPAAASSQELDGTDDSQSDTVNSNQNVAAAGKDVKSTRTKNPYPDSGSDPDSTPSSPSAFTIKPIVSKKRVASSDPVSKESNATDKKRKKRKVEPRVEDEDAKKNKDEDAKKNKDEDAKKGGIQRLWSEEDEIAILKGMNEYQSEKGFDAYADVAAFHEFINKSIHVEVKITQLKDKMRRLKDKYFASRKKGRDAVLSKPHDVMSFDLSEKIWGNTNSAAVSNTKDTKKKDEEEEEEERVKTGGVTLALLSQGEGERSIASTVKKQRRGLNASRVKKLENVAKVDTVEKKIEDGVEEGSGWEEYCCVGELLGSKDFSEETKEVLREKFGVVEKKKLRELEDKWMRMKQAELELFVQRESLIAEQVKLVLDVIKSEES